MGPKSNTTNGTWEKIIIHRTSQKNAIKRTIRKEYQINLGAQLDILLGGGHEEGNISRVVQKNVAHPPIHFLWGGGKKNVFYT